MYNNFIDMSNTLASTVTQYNHRYMTSCFQRLKFFSINVTLGVENQ